MEIRFEKDGAYAYDDVGKEIGVCSFYVSDGKWVLNHTVVDPSMKGQGIAAKLLDRVLAEARKNRVKIIAECSYVAHVFAEKSALKDEFE